MADQCCLCPPCVTLNGNRNPPLPPHTTEPQIRRLFIGDAVWLYYFERMGINQILGVILDAYACTGTLPISNGSIEAGVRDDIVALVLEVMVRQTKMGMSSTVRDRACLFEPRSAGSTTAAVSLASTRRSIPASMSCSTSSFTTPSSSTGTNAWRLRSRERRAASRRPPWRR